MKTRCVAAKGRRYGAFTTVPVVGALLFGCVDEAPGDAQTHHTYLDAGAPLLDAGSGFTPILDPRRRSDGALALGPYWDDASGSDGGDPCVECFAGNACNFYDAGPRPTSQTFQQAVDALSEFCPQLPPVLVITGDCESGALFVQAQQPFGGVLSRTYFSADGVTLASVGKSDLRSSSGCLAGPTYWPARFLCESPRVTRVICGEWTTHFVDI